MNTKNLDDQLQSTENGSIEVAGKSQDRTTATSAASPTELNAEKLGRVYFIRHGESTSNERNIFAGVLDVALTPYGKLQARHAGMDIQKKGIKFDAVYVSHMIRARETCEIALDVSQALRSPDVPIQIDYRISERSQGIFTKRNKNLGFYCIPFVDQILLVNSFSSDLLREALRSSRVTTEDIKKLFLQLDTDGSNALDKDEIMELLGRIEDMTTGERSSEDIRRHLIDYLFATLDSDKNSTVDMQQLEDYVSTYGLVANVNVVSAAASLAGG